MHQTAAEGSACIIIVLQRRGSGIGSGGSRVGRRRGVVGISSGLGRGTDKCGDLSVLGGIIRLGRLHLSGGGSLLLRLRLPLRLAPQCSASRSRARAGHSGHNIGRRP